MVLENSKIEFSVREDGEGPPGNIKPAAPSEPPLQLI